MTSFPTTGPISASIDIAWGDVRVVADSDGTTVVDVAPTDPANEKDRNAAEATTVTCSDGRLRVVGPRNMLHSWATTTDDATMIALTAASGQR